MSIEGINNEEPLDEWLRRVESQKINERNLMWACVTIIIHHMYDFDSISHREKVCGLQQNISMCLCQTHDHAY